MRAVLLSALALAGCAADSDDEDAPATMAGSGAAAVGGSPGAGAGGAGEGGAAGTTMVGGTSGGVAGVAGVMGGAGGTGGAAGGGAGGAGGEGGTSSGQSGSGSGTGGGMDSGVASDVSFFVTSYEGLKRLANEAGVMPKDMGFGGDLGGLEGADMICTQLAEAAGHHGRTWRAFLSATTGGEGGGPVHAIDRIGAGPWYDSNGRLVAEDIEGLLHERPDGDPQSVDDLPDENGKPNSQLGDSHDTLTGSDANGRLPEGADAKDTCINWTSRAAEDSGDQIMCGHSWPRCAMMGDCDDPMGGGFPFPGGGFGNGSGWISDHPVAGCKPGVNFVQNGPGDMSSQTVGAGGGYGGFYCFALNE